MGFDGDILDYEAKKEFIDSAFRKQGINEPREILNIN